MEATHERREHPIARVCHDRALSDGSLPVRYVREPMRDLPVE
jgi:hypothetical protein